VEVLEADDDGVIGAERTEQFQHRREQDAGADLSEGGVRCLRRQPPLERCETTRSSEQARSCAPDLAKQVGERCEWDDITAHGNAPTEKDVDVDLRSGLDEQRRLPDPSVTANEQDRSDPVASRADSVSDAVELRASTHESR
jgi:hypothetical protein